jgi:hypothetical protein
VLVVITAGLLSCLPCLMVKAIVERAETSRASQRDGEKRAAVHEPTWTLDCSLPPPLPWGALGHRGHPLLARTRAAPGRRSRSLDDSLLLALCRERSRCPGPSCGASSRRAGARCRHGQHELAAAQS